MLTYEELKRLADAATPAEWQERWADDPQRIGTNKRDYPHRDVATCQLPADAKLITALRNHVPEILELLKQRDRRARIDAALEDC